MKKRNPKDPYNQTKIFDQKTNNSSTKQKRSSEKTNLNLDRYQTLSQMMKRQTKSKNQKSKDTQIRRSNNQKSFQDKEQRFSLYTSLTESQYKDNSCLMNRNLRHKERVSSTGLWKTPNNKLSKDNKNNSSLIESIENKIDFRLETVMKSSSFLKSNVSLNESGINQNQPKYKFSRSKSPNNKQNNLFGLKMRESVKMIGPTSVKWKKTSKLKFSEKKDKSKVNRKRIFSGVKSIDLYNKPQGRKKSQNKKTALDSLNIYQNRIFRTYNPDNHHSRKHIEEVTPVNSNIKKRSTFKKNTNYEARSKLVQKSKSFSKKTFPHKRQSRLKSPVKNIKKSPSKKDKQLIQKKKPKSKSIEANKKKKRVRKINMFMKSRSRSMSSASDISANRSKSLNKTNSEFRKSGSFINEDQHAYKVIYGYKIFKSIGEGAYAIVYKALHVETKTPVAIKGNSI